MFCVERGSRLLDVLDGMRLEVVEYALINVAPMVECSI